MFRKITLLVFAFIASASAYAQNFYDVSTIQVISIHFPFSNWDYRLDTAKAGAEGYVVADTVTINNVQFYNCGIKYKGNSSYNANRVKNPLHIKLDYLLAQDYQGYQDIKLSNGFSDPSMIREVSSYQILRQYMDAPLCNFAKVYINGNYYGIMSNPEDIGNAFNQDHYFSSKYTFFKCNPNNVMTGLGSSLLYLGANPSSYTSYYEIKSDTGWYQLINLCSTLANNSSTINNILDVDRALWMHAFNDVMVNLDSYSGGFRQNYYLYNDHKACWIPTIWDLNMSYGGFANSGSGNLNLTTMQNLTPLLHETDANWPLISKLLANPMYKRMYVAHLRTINNENFVNANYKTGITGMRTLIDNAVQTDPNFLYTYANYSIALTNSVSGGPWSTPGVYQLMDTRATYLSNASPLTLTPPAISNVTASNTLPAYGSSVTISATVTNTNSNAVYLGYRYQKQDRFNRILMYDDGLHNDGAAGDNVYGVDIPVSSLAVQYYIYAENNNAGMFSPERAEHEFYTLRATIAQANAGDVVLNEVLPDNVTGITNEAGNFKDWIEIYNTTGNALGLQNLWLSDDGANLKKWPFDSLAFIPANGHLLVWADDKNATLLEQHTNFNLGNSGDTLFLVDANNVIADSISFGVTQADTAYARCPDGTGAFQTTIVVTPRTTNYCAMSGQAEAATNESLYVYPNPADDVIYYSGSQSSEITSITITDISGRLVKQQNALMTNSIELTQLKPGLYFISLNQENKKRAIFRVVVK